jgi:chromate transporter
MAAIGIVKLGCPLAETNKIFDAHYQVFSRKRYMTQIDPSKPDQLSIPPQPISMSKAFWYWLKLGFISFGGPAGQIAIMHQDLVENKRWISQGRYLHALNYCMLLPGPEAQQLAIYIGWLMHRTWGGIIAGALFVLPSLFILIGLSWIYLSFGHLPVVAGVLYGIKPAVTAIVLFAAYRIGLRALKNWLLWAMAGLAFVAIFVFATPFPLIVLIAGLLGALGGKLVPDKFAIGSGHGMVQQSYGKALLDDDTPIPEHAKFSVRRLARLTVTGLLLWGAAMGFLCFRYGWEGALSQMGWFFTKAALLTFGGAYAVLPYVYQGAVEHYHWLTATQMIDGLALGETTPGPLIMIVTYVGFVAGWTKALFGADQLFLAGAVAACVVTYFTFLPSFLFILAGGPLVESTHGNLKFTAPLTGITAAVVGVILNLAVFFAYHVIWPQGFHGRFETVSVLIGLYALLALIHYKAGIIPVIATCGAAGWFFTHFKLWLEQAGVFL